MATKANVNIVPRKVDEKIYIIDVEGEINAFAENSLMEAYTSASEAGARAFLLNFSGLEYMNSSGIGLLVTLLIRVSRQKQRLLAYGLSNHYRQIFKLTRLDEAVSLYDTEEQALAAARNITE
jgi:anti-sigma B factor antagonist